MSTEKDSNEFDNAIKALYLQRKNSIEAPDIHVENKGKRSPLKIRQGLSILALGSVASFGILAVINHFSHLPNSQTEQTTAMVYIDTIEVERFDEDNQPINMEPPKHELRQLETLAVQPKRTFEIHTEIEVKPEAAKAITLNSNDVARMSLSPEAFKDKVPQPTFKVMPELTSNIAAHKSGSVKLAYKLSTDGKVKNITIIQSNVHRDLERSAKKALSQWRYPKEVNATNEFQVEFMFK